MTDRKTFEAACLETPTEAAGPFDWAPAPKRTEWGAGMVLADVEIDRDHTLSIYAEADQVPNVAAALRRFLGPPRTLTDAEIDYDGNPYTFERLAEWLDRKFNRHHEDEDRAGAMLLRLQANEIVRLREFLAIWIGDGSLQTFEHREKFRAAARAVLEVPNARLSGAGTAAA